MWLHLTDVAVIPCFIDPALFFRRAKSRQIGLIPRSSRARAAVIQSLVMLKYPELGLGWRPIEQASERETAEIFGASEIVLSLPFLEVLRPRAARSHGVGRNCDRFDGYGGQEYATDGNVFLVSPGSTEDVDDVRRARSFGSRTATMRFDAHAGRGTRDGAALQLKSARVLH